MNQLDHFYNDSLAIGKDLYFFITQNAPKSDTLTGFSIMRFGLAFRIQDRLIKIFKSSPNDEQYTLQLYKDKIPEIYYCRKPELIRALSAA